MAHFVTSIPKEFRETLTNSSTSYVDTAKLCDLIIEKLNDLHVIAKRLKENDLEWEIFDCIEHFEFCRDLATGEIPKNEWDDYGFEGNLTELFNDYVRQFWDICDTQLEPATSTQMEKKFCWVKL